MFHWALATFLAHPRVSTVVLAVSPVLDGAMSTPVQPGPAATGDGTTGGPPPPIV